MLKPSHVFRGWLRFAPPAVHERLMALTVNHLLRGQSIRERLSDLQGKRIRICATDVPLALTFELVDGRVVPCNRAPDVSFSGTLADLLKLAMRREDPDTLFFQRRLSIEGETETGLHLKNVLDSLDFDFSSRIHAVLPSRLVRAAGRTKQTGLAIQELFRVRPPGIRRSSRPEARKAEQ
ncbi:MAG TPA: SCP2 sterol-binding domain-containing protein [Steroidobacteraceae bacterium]|nr:SCP2 sterol-binding domain-containing protein [Steroidobacteraceae bacterium]